MAVRSVPVPPGGGAGGRFDLPGEDLSGADIPWPRRGKRGCTGLRSPWWWSRARRVEVLGDRPPAAISRPQDLFVSASTPGATDPQLSGFTDGSALELLERVDRDGVALAGLTDVAGPAGLVDQRLALIAAGWLAGFRSARTRRAYGADLAAFALWCAPRGLDVLGARRVQVDLHTTGLLDAGAASSSVARRLSALSSFYRFAAAHDLRVDNPVVGVRRPAVDPDHTRTVGLTRDQARALVAAASTPARNARARPHSYGCCCTTGCGSTS